MWRRYLRKIRGLWLVPLAVIVFVLAYVVLWAEAIVRRITGRGGGSSQGPPEQV